MKREEKARQLRLLPLHPGGKCPLCPPFKK